MFWDVVKERKALKVVTVRSLKLLPVGPDLRSVSADGLGLNGEPGRRCKVAGMRDSLPSL